MAMQLNEQAAPARSRATGRRGSGSPPAAAAAEAESGEAERLKAELAEAQGLQEHLIQQNEQYEDQIHAMQQLQAAEKLGNLCKSLEKENSKLAAKNEILKDEVAELRAR